VIGNNVVNQEGIPMQIDFRDVYASVLKDWFGVATADIESLFEHTVSFYPLLGACTVGIEENEEIAKDQAILFPNPAIEHSTVRFACNAEWVKIEVYDFMNKKVMDIFDGNLGQGRHDIFMNLEELAAGKYVVLIQKESGTVHSSLAKVQM
jgi:hypothetical protein